MKKSCFSSLLLILFLTAASLSLQAQSIADQVAGIYKGKLQNKSVKLNNYKIKIEKISDFKVKIQALSGAQSQTLEVELVEQSMGSQTVIKFKFPTDHLLNNGMFVKSNGRLSYAVHLGTDDPRNLEVFSGEKQ